MTALLGTYALHLSTWKLEKAGVGFVSISEQMDFSTPIGKVILANLAAFGQYYSDNLSTEVKKGLGERAKQGLWVGPIPFGYVKGDGNLLEIVPQEAELLQRAYEMYACGTHTDQTIATWLNRSELRSRSPRRAHEQRQPLWNREAVGSILRNPFYTSKVKYQGELLPGLHPVIISEALYTSVQKKRKEHFMGPSTYAIRAQAPNILA